MPSITPPRFAASAPGLRAPVAGRTLAQHAKLIATFSHPGMPVEVYPLIACSLFSLTYIAVRFWDSKDVTDIQFFNHHDGVPWAAIPQNDGRNLSSMVATGDGITTRKFSYPKPKSFWSKKFEPEQPHMA